MSEDRATRDPGGGASRPPALRRLLGDSVGALAFPLVAILISFLIGAIIMVALGFIPTFIVVKILDGADLLRVPREVELVGLDFEDREAYDSAVADVTAAERAMVK